LYFQEETGFEYIPRSAPLDESEDVGQSKITLTSYKKAIEPIIAVRAFRNYLSLTYFL